jgi:hypothetical protein
VKASRIGWLGIPGDTIAWGRLARSSRDLPIAVGTLLLTMLTVTGFALPSNVDRLLPLLPLIVVLAGELVRRGGRVPQRRARPSRARRSRRAPSCWLSAAFFGWPTTTACRAASSAWSMSGVLGWFLAREHDRDARVRRAVDHPLPARRRDLLDDRAARGPATAPCDSARSTAACSSARATPRPR